MTTVLSDVRLVLRIWVKTPGFAAIAILSIALGIGANAAVFTLVDQILLRALPVANPAELVHVSFTGHRYGVAPGDPLAMAAAAALLLAVSVAAGLVPSTRAARLNPTDALRAD